jgi:hypothetical protein
MQGSFGHIIGAPQGHAGRQSPQKDGHNKNRTDQEVLHNSAAPRATPAAMAMENAGRISQRRLRCAGATPVPAAPMSGVERRP